MPNGTKRWCEEAGSQIMAACLLDFLQQLYFLSEGVPGLLPALHLYGCHGQQEIKKQEWQNI